MAHRDGWQLEHLSDAQLLESLSSVLGTQHRTLAALVAHLAEVEERRLHLEAAYSSMFAYCVGRLGMSEDEACRRIDLTRLTRAFPALFAELESGQITLSVALLLKPVLTPDNHRELLCASRGKSSQQTRELLAARFPKADVPSSIRKLPERRPAMASEPAQSSSPAQFSPVPEHSSALQPPSGTALPPALPRSATAAALAPQMPAPVPTSSLLQAEPVGPPSASAGPRPLPGPPAPAPAWRGSIEPLSAQRYRIQFTADADLKRKLELARDLLRHAHPSGDFAAILTRALDLLLDDLQRRRFGAGARRKSAVPAKAEGSPPSTKADPRAHSRVRGAASPASFPDPSPSPNASPPSAASDENAHSTTAAPANPAAKRRRSHIPRAARRAVLERDGLGCSWVDASGVRCGSLAWLELDHRQPAGKGGSSEPDNVRLLCHAHNQLAAEHAYGRAHIERACRSRQRATPPARERNPASHSQHEHSLPRRGRSQPWRTDES